MIHGNTEGIRASLLTEMDALYEMPLDADLFAPPELIFALARFSTQIRREISVYLSRGGEVLDVTIGDIASVPLKAMHLRRSLERLSGIRCIHTHPGGVPDLSDVDIQSMITLRLDAMAAIGVLDNRATGMQAAFLGEYRDGAPQAEVTPVVPISQIPQAAWMARIEEGDRLLARQVVETDGDRPEKAMLVGTQSEAQLKELASLAETAGAKVMGVVLQKRDKPDNATYIGAGKAQELSLVAQGQGVDLIIFDDELSGAQTRNLEGLLGIRVIDRTTLILDIFAQRAQSAAGKLQVEMAQLAYKLPRLIGEGVSLSRLGGGIGTRGPGETKLEISRRRIRGRLSDLRQEVDALSQQRSVQRARREKNKVPVVALVGYTNTGKSSLLNRLSDAGVLAEDMLFATLDPVTRRITLPEGTECLIVDTVGFIRKLPHALVDAFRSTLEEAALADLLVIVSDASSPDLYAQHDVVLDVLAGLGAGEKPMIDVLNKTDLVTEVPHMRGAIAISVKDGQGIDALLSAIEQQLTAAQRTARLLIPYTQGALLSQLHEEAVVLEEAFEDGGTLVTARMDAPTYDRMLSQLGQGALRPPEGAAPCD